MSLIKRFFQPAQPAQQVTTPSVPEHPNLWMYQ